MLRLAVVGLGKMGMSHLSMINAHPNVSVVGICDATGYILDVLQKYTGLKTFTDYDRMLDELAPDAVLLATPSKFHAAMVRKALERGIHVFCEKPFTLTGAESSEMASLARARQLVGQVGYHYRFVGAFKEVKRLLDLGAIGQVTHVLAEAYGPVVLKAKSSTWRNQRDAGGGCLYDYAAHPINLLNWYFGSPASVEGSVLNSIFSADTDDEVYSTFHFPNDGPSAQLSVNWSDESQRKMTTKLTFWGTRGRIYADRQEVQAYLREPVSALEGYEKGWNVRYTTDLTDPVWFYLRGEEYSAQLDHFVNAATTKSPTNINDFDSAAETDRVIEQILADHHSGRSGAANTPVARKTKSSRFSFLGR